MQPRFVDLHTHTTASDGTDAPRDLIRRAASLKLAAVAEMCIRDRFGIQLQTEVKLWVF